MNTLLVHVFWDLLARLHLAKVLLSRPADRANPVVGNLIEGRTAGDSPVGVALLGVVDEPAGRAEPFLGLGLGLCLVGDAHAAAGAPSSGTPIALSRRVSDL